MSIHDGEPRLPAAVLWDMDGTLVDTEPYWIAEEQAVVEAYGGVWTTEHALQLVGNDLRVAAEYLRVHGPIPLTVEEIVDRMLAGVSRRAAEHVPWRPGALELLESLREAGVRCALVTMSWRQLVDVVLDALPRGTFAAVLSGDQVKHGKPHPEPYRAAARLLGVDVAHCVAIEDSPPGVASAVAAGVPTLAVPNHVPVPEIDGAVQHASLVGLTAYDLLPALR